MISVIKTTFLALIAIFFFTGCTMNSLSSNQIGHYRGTNPCADCPGILVELDLKEKAQYHAVLTYTERNISNKENGIWKIVNNEDATGKQIQVIELSPFKATSKTYYLLKNNTTLQLLDTLKLPVETAILKKDVH